ncbi:MAG: hypothetical protein COU22_03645 [Candidatus Komeilibacteria bacterium CG10_big_fil_rev_8_21_14_0_10_41_13]|uniref:Amino acid transporter transmembrane domain-containing protein n=1 Tax=Candidatus Komeilibacteria bacterium CG10_big_fil_rev_8_21_14_0_10_41_13 TaxID=1974476 RepID=A0A2M6WBN5_9BACT|nr:MAG: hypothetical protein COU22_03645 [Candidatus Komeilibacteria bacterium CG10_big_fil_rev_8_21_14_0_10_41_13]
MRKDKPLFEAISLLTGTIIGAGVLGIPYVVYKSGFLTGLVLMVVICLSVLLINLHVGEIVLSTNKRHQMTGYAGKYLGRWGKYLMFGSVVFGFYGALLAYIIGEGQVLAALTGGNAFIYSLIFFVFGCLLVYVGLNVIKETEFLLTMVILVIVVIISIWGSRFLDWQHLTEFDLTKLLIPYGVIFFSIGGSSAIPHMREVLKGKEYLLKKSIIIGTSIPFFVYLIFTLVVIGVSGPAVTEVASVGLGEAMGRSMVIFGNLFAFFTMATSFLTLGLALRNTYQYDFNLRRNLAWALTVSVPLIFFLLGTQSFIKVMGTVGAIGGGIEGILIGLIFYSLKKKAERKAEYTLSKSPLILSLLSLLFIGGIIYTLWSL